MKALLLSLLSIFSLLFLMASCQNLGAQRALSSYDIRTEIVYSGNYELEEQVSELVTKASATKTMAMKKVEFN
jgi:tRNA A37 threonylcarbamoyladenosine modification protein TsaB